MSGSWYPSRTLGRAQEWLSGFEFLALDQPGFWEQIGYHDDGDPLEEERRTWVNRLRAGYVTLGEQRHLNETL